MRTTGPLAAVAATALALSLAGCSGLTGGGELTYEDSPLNEYLSAAYGGDMSPEEQQKQMDEQNREREELMAECMAEEGFEYEPNLDNGGVVMSGEDVKWEPDKKEWVEKYGFGAVNNPFNEEGAQPPPEEEYVDPNQDYVQSLSESEQQAYWETAYGAPQTEEMSEDENYEYKWEDYGCQGWADHEMQGDADPLQTDEFADLRKKMEEFWSTTQESSEMKDLNAEWATCMEEAGEPGFASPMEAQQSIYDAQGKIYEAGYGDGTTPVDMESPDWVDPNESPEMKALGEREIELALVDLECRTELSYAQESLKIQFALEEKFVAANKADLDAFKAAAEQSK